jgi:GDP-4-dehydro-6-deoxy-D-mannose reductase
VRVQKALISGASGFTGKYLVRLLTSRGIATSALSLRGSQIGDSKFVADVLKKADPDYLFHLAGLTRSDSIEEILRVNVLYAVTLLKASREAHLDDRPLLLVGTAAEYGQISDHDLPITEETECRPYNAYGTTKLAQTLIGLAAAESERRPLVVVRPFNIIGNGMPGYLALESFRRQIQQIKAGRQSPVIRVGNLNASRDFIDVGDVVRLYWTVVRNPQAYGQIFNLCTGIPTSIGAILDLLIQASSLDIEVQCDKAFLKEIDVSVHYGSNKKLQQLIGDFRYTPIEKTIHKIIA